MSAAISVSFADGGGYPIVVDGGARWRASDYVGAQVAIVSDATVYPLYGEALVDALAATGRQCFPIVVEAGEKTKTMATVARIIDRCVAEKVNRDACIVALGGGVVGDVAGFAAAIYMRGIGLVQAPTTLLAQVDAAIGGKTGVNHPGGKNLIGAFYQPRAVLCDSDTLATLPPREYYSGLAEVVKYGLLGDAEFFQWLEDHADSIVNRAPEAVRYLTRISAQAKAGIVVADERETSGRRALLNLGHTFAHAIETALGYGVWLHGEAVAYGMILAARLSQRVAGFSAADSARLSRLLHALQLPTRAPENLALPGIWAHIALDKKNLSGKKRFILLRAIGDAYLSEVDDAVAQSVLAAGDE